MFDRRSGGDGAEPDDGPGGTAVRGLAGRARPLPWPATGCSPSPRPVGPPCSPRAACAGGARWSSSPAPLRATTPWPLAVAMAASQTGSWCAAVGLPALGLVMAAGLGVCLERLALVPDPGRPVAGGGRRPGRRGRHRGDPASGGPARRCPPAGRPGPGAGCGTDPGRSPVLARWCRPPPGGWPRRPGWGSARATAICRPGWRW